MSSQVVLQKADKYPMGIRIRRTLGYGLNDIISDDEAVDERLNLESWVFTHEDIPSTEEYIEWIRAGNSSASYSLDLMLEKEEIEKISLDSAFHWQPEYGCPKTLIVQPLSMHEWSRYDDAIDYVLETELRPDNDLEPRAERLRGGIYPWNGLWIDAKTGLRMPQNVMVYIRMRNNDDYKKYATELDAVAQTLGFSNHKEADRRLAPEIPEPIQDICKFAKLFKNDHTINELRPMLYTYWS